jgi:hypothetical protein
MIDMKESTVYPNGIYRVINGEGVRVRGTPSTAHDGNIVKYNGAELKLTMGKTFNLYGIADDLRKNGWVWGIITVPDLLIKQTLYVGLNNLNTQFAELVQPFNNPRPIVPVNPDWVRAVDEYLRATNIPLPPPFL